MSNDKSKLRPSVPKPGPVAFRRAIEQAEAEGADRADMLLRLTARDVAHLKLDRSLAVEDISFSDGVMRFLGVKVVTGGVLKSALEAGAAAEG